MQHKNRAFHLIWDQPHSKEYDRQNEKMTSHAVTAGNGEPLPKLGDDQKPDEERNKFANIDAVHLWKDGNTAHGSFTRHRQAFTKEKIVTDNVFNIATIMYSSRTGFEFGILFAAFSCTNVDHKRSLWSSGVLAHVPCTCRTRHHSTNY